MSVSVRVCVCVSVCVECMCRIGTISPMPPSGAYHSNNLPEQMDQVAVENAKKSFLQSWSEYIETTKKSTEIYERQVHLTVRACVRQPDCEILLVCKNPCRGLLARCCRAYIQCIWYIRTYAIYV
jgi:hypothetical protein